MKSQLHAVFAAVLFSSTLLAADAGVTLIGMGTVPGDALDLSGLDGTICRREDATACIPRATFGGWGSGLTYTGHDNVFLAVPDRGPFDGRTTPGVPYLNRFHFLHMVVDVGVPFPNIRTTLLDTRFMVSANRILVGDAYAFDADPLATLRFDPEGVRVGPEKTFYVSDEYGPYVDEFDRDGHLIRRLPVPAKFMISKPMGDVDDAGNSLKLFLEQQSLRTAGKSGDGRPCDSSGRPLSDRICRMPSSRTTASTVRPTQSRRAEQPDTANR